MSDTKFIDFNVLKRAYEVLRNIINNNKRSTDASISDVSTRVDSALAATESLANDAVNYATKEQLEQHRLLSESKYATKEELQSGIGGIVSFEFKIVDELPVNGVSQIVYLMRNSASSGDNIYNEYLWIASSNKYERIGSMDLDLSGYLTKLDASSIYATKNDLSAGLITKSDTGHVHNYAGSSSAGGVAVSANKLTKSAGSSIQPVYFNNGIPIAIEYTISKSVPEDAVFTDTTYGQANENALGLIRLYTSKGQNIDGSMTQKAITDAISSGISSGTSDSAINDSDGNPINTTYLKKTVAQSTYLSKSENAVSASKLATARNIAISGAVTGNANFDGSGNISISTNVNHNHDGVYQPVGSYAATSHTHNYAGSGSAGGSATSAVKLATARNIAISGAVSGSANFDGSSDITIDTTVDYGTSAPSSLANGKLYCVIES